ncbi:hypothetical protein F441_22801 [Phytophthora nicotianae CJ01A1]|uniref:Uncharacterized protein n=1 Tax=Phytophthora nicotianae CJ01A1 TaxID=1317063 RepID=W2VNE4_PHYNI|nr:hypothetical protein F441_22801 [Phytophthora nicotianae CJ01A1]
MIGRQSTDSEEKAAEEILGDLNTRSPCVSDGDDDYEYASDSEDSSDSDVYNHEHNTASTQEEDLVITEHPIPFSTMQEARVVLDGLENARCGLQRENTYSSLQHFACGL